MISVPFGSDVEYRIGKRSMAVFAGLIFSAVIISCFGDLILIGLDYLKPYVGAFGTQMVNTAVFCHIYISVITFNGKPVQSVFISRKGMHHCLMIKQEGKDPCRIKGEL